MEMNGNDSEENYAQESLKGISDYHTSVENKLPMETANEVLSTGNGTPADDLSSAPSEDRSPMLTPNTTQDWTNENLEGTPHQDEGMPTVDTIKKSNLDFVTQDFMHQDLENVENTEQHTETIAEGSSLEQSTQSSVTEDQPQGT
jgi:hypothetical protein